MVANTPFPKSKTDKQLRGFKKYGNNILQSQTIVMLGVAGNSPQYGTNGLCYFKNIAGILDPINFR